jgi:2-oxoglutarate ferredoxin oxidoreductase subunit gamma
LEAVVAPLKPGESLESAEFIEIRFGGSGGQGVILMGVILAVAATRDHRHVVQTQSYGPEARGGYSRSDVIIARCPVDFPELLGVDLLVALSDEAAHHYAPGLRSNGVLIYDSEKVLDPPRRSGQSYGIPFERLALEASGRAQTTNILTLGAVVGLTSVVSRNSLELAVRSMVPPGTEEMNLKALQAGLDVTPARV